MVATLESRLPRLPRLLRVGVALAALSTISTLLSIVSYSAGGGSIIWLSNGLMIGVLVTCPRRQWPFFLTFSYLVDLACNFAMHTAPLGCFAYSLCNVIEIALAAALVTPALAPDPDLTEPRQLRSLLVGMLVASATASALVALYLRVTQGQPLGSSAQLWFASDLLGIAIVCPLYLSFRKRRQFSHRSLLEVAAIFAVLGGVSFIIFAIVKLPMLWVVLLFLVMVGAWLGFTGASLGLLIVALIGGYFTVKGHGPLSSDNNLSIAARIFIFQCFTGVTMLTLYITEVVRAQNTRISKRLQSSETRFRLLAEASRDVIVLAGLDGCHLYVSPAVTELLGWTPAELVGRSYSETAHPEDATLFRQLLEGCRSGSELSPSLSFRSRTKDGSYLWLEANVRLFFDEQTREPSGFVYVLRDITIRKAAEDELHQAYLTAQQQAMVDGLTGVANRRLLDETLQQEWSRALRDRTPLSLLLIDVDWFKMFNDAYGHLAGDECLQKVAAAIQQVLKRPQDLLARYGGEEFVVVLPNTHSRGAELISERIRQVVENSGVPHSGSCYGVATVSIGCATMVPAANTDWSQLLRNADNALYLAKDSGRNRLQISNELAEVN